MEMLLPQRIVWYGPILTCRSVICQPLCVSAVQFHEFYYEFPLERLIFKVPTFQGQMDGTPPRGTPIITSQPVHAIRYLHGHLTVQ